MSIKGLKKAQDDLGMDLQHPNSLIMEVLVSLVESTQV